MPIVGFICAIAAAVLFTVDTARTKSPTSAGLALLTVALIIQYIHPVTDVLIH